MKKLILTILIVFTGISLLAQSGVYLSPALVAAGGGSDGIPDGSSITLSRWRLSKINVITLSGDYSVKEKGLVSEESGLDWHVTLYPNPVSENLHVEFELTETTDFVLKLTNITGRVLMIQEAETTLSGDIIELDMSGYASTLYLLHISTPDQKSRKIYRIQKI
ncbi:MAG: T9SS type A sorting domain-containing protein [Bacteroidales bacterium]|nr:T9SS type A sorting domain-containing protein [Bacteroidales bacterium]